MASSTPNTLPMPTPTVPRKPLLSFKLLSFDIYGTLVDWETSIVKAFQPLLSHLPSSSPYAHLKADRLALAAHFNQHEHALQVEQPTLRYDKVLTEAYLRIAKELDISYENPSELESEAISFGNSVGEWTAFPDTVDACKRLSKFYKLVPLSNIDRASFTKTLNGPLHGVPFWHSYVAEEIGSYKPDLRNFEYLISHVKQDSESEGGEPIREDEILHTAQSIMHDHIPAKKMGLSSVWIARKGAGMGGKVEELHNSGEVGYGWRFATLGEMADAVEAEANQRDSKA
jgi:2-haloalkanoic acid dehalogenase type II